MQQLHPRAVWIFFFKFLPILIILAFFLNSFVAQFLIFKQVSQSGITDLVNQKNLTPEDVSRVSENLMPKSSIFGVLLGNFLVVLLIGIILAYVWARLTYKFYRYELTDLGFKKEHGVIWKKYVTIPYDRIQNVDIYRGLFARILGLSDLHIQTAGMSVAVGSYGGVATEGRLLGLSKDVAEKLRDELILRARPNRNQTQGQGL